MTRFAFAQGAEHAAAVARVIDGDNARAGPVFISGATGLFAAAINGYYAPTQEKGFDARSKPPNANEWGKAHRNASLAEIRLPP